MTIASLRLISSSVDSDQATFPFLTAVTPNGFPLTAFAHQEEELTSMGVSGRRWRTTFDQGAPFTMETSQDYTAYSTAADAAEDYYQARGRLGDLTITYGNRTAIYNRLHVLDVQVRVSPAKTVGTGVTASATAIVYATWTLVKA